METKENGLATKTPLPTITDLFADNLELAYKNEQLNLLLNHEPKKEWVKKHPFIRDYSYLPIDKIEFLLRKIFKKYRIEIIREGTAFNGVYCVVRVWYLNPISGEMDYNDGIGAAQLQTKSGSSPADLGNINNGALSMAFPIAKTVAIKDACDHFGKLFGADLNRKDTLPFTMDKAFDIPNYDDLKELFEVKKHLLTPQEAKDGNRILNNKETASYKKLQTKLAAL